MIWQVILAWVLYLALAFAIAYKRSTSINTYTPMLNETDWIFFWVCVVWFVGLGLLITSLVI